MIPHLQQCFRLASMAYVLQWATISITLALDSHCPWMLISFRAKKSYNKLNYAECWKQNDNSGTSLPGQKRYKPLASHCTSKAKIPLVWVKLPRYPFEHCSTSGGVELTEQSESNKASHINHMCATSFRYNFPVISRCLSVLVSSECVCVCTGHKSPLSIIFYALGRIFSTAKSPSSFLHSVFLYLYLFFFSPLSTLFSLCKPPSYPSHNNCARVASIQQQHRQCASLCTANGTFLCGIYLEAHKLFGRTEPDQ